MNTTPSIQIVQDIDQSRLKTRTVSPENVAERVQENPDFEKDGWAIYALHGGGVANAYDYPALTSAAVAIKSPTGEVKVWCARLNANKVTYSGAVRHCVGPEVSALYDHRITSPERIDKAWTAIKEIF